jgi:molecular chaperone GrpE
MAVERESEATARREAPVAAPETEAAANEPGGPAPVEPPPEMDVEAQVEADDAVPSDVAPDAAGGGDGEVGSAEAEADLVESDLEALAIATRERDEYLSLAQRTQADFENFRKRAARDARAADARGVARLARELLPAIDSLGRALDAAPEGEAGDVVAGVRLVHTELLGALARVGIESFSPEGEPFDPEVHEAMAQHPVEGVEAGTVIEVYQQGYRVGTEGVVLRPARVVVAG